LTGQACRVTWVRRCGYYSNWGRKMFQSYKVWCSWFDWEGKHVNVFDLPVSFPNCLHFHYWKCKMHHNNDCGNFQNGL